MGLGRKVLYLRTAEITLSYLYPAGADGVDLSSHVTRHHMQYVYIMTCRMQQLSNKFIYIYIFSQRPLLNPHEPIFVLALSSRWNPPACICHHEKHSALLKSRFVRMRLLSVVI